MKKLSIFLITTHWEYFLLLGLLIGITVFNQVGNVDYMIPTIDNPFISIFLILGIGFMQFFAVTFFYADDDIRQKEINGEINNFKGLVRWDNYFPIKINTDISFTKRLCGYVYVILARVTVIAIAYFLCVIMCGLATK